jgi:hypothetical protein
VRCDIFIRPEFRPSERLNSQQKAGQKKLKKKLAEIFCIQYTPRPTHTPRKSVDALAAVPLQTTLRT